MALEAIPSKTEASLGQEKSDNVPEGVTLDPRYWTTAAQLERIKSAIIALATDVGLDVSPAAGSLKGRVDALESAGETAAERLTTTDATPTEIYRFTPTSETAGVMAITCVARDTATGAVGAKFARALFRSSAGVAAVSGTWGASEELAVSLATIGINVSAVGADVVIHVTGVVAKTLNWAISVQRLQADPL